MAATDGTLKDGEGRASFVIADVEAGRGFPASSSYEAETRAIEDLFRFLASGTIVGHVTLLVDNGAAAKAIFDTDVRNSQFTAIRAMAALRVWLERVTTNELTVSWCPSHVGIPENKYADKLAGAGECPTPARLITRAVVLKRIWNDAGTRWRRLWATHSDSLLTLRKGRDEIQPTTGPEKARFIKACDGSLERFSRFVQIATNHMPSGNFRLRFHPKSGSNTTCNFCPEGPLLTRSHIMCRRVRYKFLSSSMAPFAKERGNFKRLIHFLKHNPTAATFGDLDAEGIG